MPHLPNLTVRPKMVDAFLVSSRPPPPPRQPKWHEGAGKPEPIFLLSRWLEWLVVEFPVGTALC